MELVIADNGQGIEPEAMERLFQPFFTTKENKCNGLGLSPSKRIVEDHGGKMALRSSVRPERNVPVVKIRLPQENNASEQQWASA